MADDYVTTFVCTEKITIMGYGSLSCIRTYMCVLLWWRIMHYELFNWLYTQIYFLSADALVKWHMFPSSYFIMDYGGLMGILHLSCYVGDKDFAIMTFKPRNLKVNKRLTVGFQGAVSIRKTVLPGMAIPMLKIRRPNGRLIFNMEIAICR